MQQSQIQRLSGWDAGKRRETDATIKEMLFLHTELYSQDYRCYYTVSDITLTRNFLKRNFKKSKNNQETATAVQKRQLICFAAFGSGTHTVAEK